MYFTTKKLLRYSPTDALLIMFNQETGMQLHPDNIKIKDIESQGGTQTRVLLEGYTPENPLANQRYDGEGWFNYQRIDVEEVFFDLQHVITPLPTTTHDILDAIERQSGIKIDFSDVPLAAVHESPWLFSPIATSLRWVGEVRLTVGPKIVCDDLSGSLTSYVLPDYQYPEPATRLRDFLLVNVLPDFEMPVCDCTGLDEVITNNILPDYEYPIFECIVYPLEEFLLVNVLPDFTYPDVLTYRITYKIRNNELDGFYPMVPNVADIIVNKELNGFNPVLGDISNVITVTELDGFDPVT